MIKFNEKNEIVKDEINAILVGVEISSSIDISMEELSAITEAAGGKVLAVMTQKLDRVDRATYLGSGKVEELKDMCNRMDADTIILNDELSGSQMRNLEDITGKRIIDRTVLILDIFASRAISKEGKLQVELAQLEYRLPRMQGFGKSLSRQGGGIGTRGPGEKKLEVDKRHIRKRVDDIRRELKEIAKNRMVQRAKRENSELPLVALVGYTNAGKSAIMNRMLLNENNEDRSDKIVSSKNMLFETLDTQQRLIKLENNREFILIDTVGFVSKLPHNLIDAFKATLEEVKYADLLIHVVDGSYEEYKFQEEVTKKVLKELDVDEKKYIKVYNKVDLIEDVETLETVENKAVFISATTGKNFGSMLDRIKEELFKNNVVSKFLIPFDKGEVINFIYEKGNIISQEYTNQGTLIEVELSKENYERIKKYDSL